MKHLLSTLGFSATTLLGVCAAPAANALPPSPAAAADVRTFKSAIRPFFEANCFDCHGDTEQKGGLRLDTLAPDFANPALQRQWIEVFDKLSTGQMPPKKKPRPPAAQAQQVLAYLKNGITAVELAHRNADGRVMLRRLNRAEYERTVHDLLGIDVDLKDLLPEDASSMGFDNIADALNVSSVLMERYLEAADVALDAAIPAGPKPELKHYDVAYGFDTRRNPNDYRLKSGMRILEDQTLVLFNSGDYSPIVCDNLKVPVEGDYHIRLRAYAYQSKTPITVSARRTRLRQADDLPARHPQHQHAGTGENVRRSGRGGGPCRSGRAVVFIVAAAGICQIVWECRCQQGGAV